MTSEGALRILVLIGRNAQEARSIGYHLFVAVPRAGEEVVVDAEGQELVLQVHSVSHVCDPTESSPGKLVHLPSREVRIMCDEI